MKAKKLLFLTGTRADYGKLKSLIKKLDESDIFEVYIFVTGMHMLTQFGMTVEEVEKDGFGHIYKYINQNKSDTMDSVLAKTIQGLSDYVKELEPDMIIVHGDRVEAMAGAIVGSLNNILVSHIEGGEVSGTIDELIRHAVSKMSHLHFVSNELAQKRLIQLGEKKESIFVIGSPDIDVMLSNNLPKLEQAKARYEILFKDYSILMYHPVTTELNSIEKNIREVVNTVIESNKNYIVIYPNNDLGSDIIINEFNRLKDNPNIRIYPSIRFEYFLTFLKNAEFIIGNSSAGVREAPIYGVPTINLGTRQNGRATAQSIYSIKENKKDILELIKNIRDVNFEKKREFGFGGSDNKFIGLLSSNVLWKTSKQKLFVTM